MYYIRADADMQGRNEKGYLIRPFGAPSPQGEGLSDETKRTVPIVPSFHLEKGGDYPYNRGSETEKRKCESGGTEYGAEEEKRMKTREKIRMGILVCAMLAIAGIMLGAGSMAKADQLGETDLYVCGGEDGGRIVCCGTPEEIRGCEESITGKFIG